MEETNRRAIELVDEAIDFADELRVGVHHLDDDAVVLDFGVDAPGGIEAGLLLAEIQTGGFATVQTRMDEVAGAPVPHVELSTDHPRRSLLRSQKAGWRLDVEGFSGVGSGPARLLRREDGASGGDGDALGDDGAGDFAVLAIETADLPGEGVAGEVANATGVPTSGVFLPVVPAASTCGSVAMAARAAEVALFRLDHLGYDPDAVLSATGSAPVAPVAGDERTALVRTNDALSYGARAHLVVEDDWDRFDEVPSATTGAPPFTNLLTENRDLEAIEDAVAPAAVTVDVSGGPTYVEGSVDEAVLRDRLDLAE